MKAAIFDSATSPVRYGVFPEPEPGDGEKEYEVVAAGLHPLVRSLAGGTHYGSEHRYPLVPGADAVARGADGVLRYCGGVRGPWGTFAERIATRLGLPVPDGADPAVVAGALNPGMSSWMPLTSRAAEVESLGTVLIVGATGAAGRLAVQNAFALGAERVVGVGRDAERLGEVEALGAVPVPLSDGAAGIRAALGAAAPSTVLDYVWGSAAETVWEALGRTGLDEDRGDIVHVQIGGMGGPTAQLPAALLRSRRYLVRGSGAGSASMADIIAQLPGYMARIADGSIVAPVRRFPLSRVADAWAHAGPERAVVVPD